jgi:cysteine-rich repeat protein
MNLRRFLPILLVLGPVIALGLAAFWVDPALAQVDTGLAEVGETVKLSSTDPRIIVTRIINVALGLVGIVLVVLVLYAGFLWMTSGGEADKVEKAKKILINALIGLAIVLSAWAITRFVIERLLSATQEGGGVGGTGTGYTGGLGGGAGGTSFKVKSITPQGETPLKPRNVEVKIVFTKNVDANSASAIVVLKDGGTTVGGSIQVEGSLVTFVPTQACPPPNEARKCFDADSSFTVKVGNTVKSTGGQTITCGGFAPACEANFKTGNLVDTQPPSVSVTYPSEGMPVKENSLVDVFAFAQDDSGIAAVKFFDGVGSFAIDGPNATNTPMSFDAQGLWDTVGALRGAHSLSAEALDLDANTAKSASVTVMVRPEHCFDSEINEGETGLNCGGDPNSTEYCGACSGGSCTSNSQCASGFCQSGVCVEKPIIKYVSPLNGKAGTFVSIAGFNFGTSTGVVKFLGDPANPADDKVAVAPQACVAAGIQTWSNSQAIVAVPEGAASGPLELTNAVSQLSDRSDTDPGPSIPHFVVDNSEHPGLCAIQPPTETVGKEVDAIGSGLGQTAGLIIFGSDDYQLQASPWSDAKAHFKVPIVNNATYRVWAKTAAGLSNSVEFTVIEKYLSEAPQLSSLDPVVGPKQEYVTLSGKNFGYTVGTVVFTGITANGPTEAVGDTSFPAACAAGFWRDDTIIVKVPEKFKNGEQTTDGKYQVKVTRSDSKESNSLEFTLDDQLTQKPGICAIEPTVGPEKTVVQIFGDRFGFDKPIVTFHPNKNSLVESNTNQAIKTSVPANAATGPVKVIAQGQSSNPVNFQVRNCNEAPEICGPANKFKCCPSGACRAVDDACDLVSTKAEFAWQISTGLIPLAPYVIEECRPDLPQAPTPSPSPWLNRAGGDQAPVDAAIKMRFSQKLEPSSVTPSAFKLYACNSSKADPCDGGELVQFAMSLVAENDQQDVVTLKPYAKFAVNTTYLVTVSTAIKGAGETGDFMLERQDCGVGPNNTKLGYCFRFKTKATAEPSQIGAVGVTPRIFTFSDTGVPTKYEAVPESLNDKCIIINCDLFNWNWAAGDTRGSITNNTGGPQNYGLCEQQGQGNAETGDVPVDITAALVDSALQGLGLMYVKFVPPQVLEYAPNCADACTNALVWARFSSKLDIASALKPDNIQIRKCFNENCHETELGQPIITTGVDLVDDKILEIGHDPFEPGAFYWVLLRGGPNAIDSVTKENIGIKGLNGVPMTGTNHPMGFVWTFRVKVGQDAFCKADRVEVVPREKFELNINGRQVFQATPFSKPDNCSANGQKLVSSGPVDWQSSDLLVADFYRVAGMSLVATDPKKLPLGCSGKCLAAGSGGLAGRLAICGNNQIETTNPRFCIVPAGQNYGKTLFGHDCWLFAPGAKAGEECEPGISGLDACNPDTCLFRPVKLVSAGGTCGDGVTSVAGVRQLGEACDYGLTCVGGAGSTTTPAVPDYTACNTAEAKATCENAGGICSMHDYRGCSAGCRHLGAITGKTTCGNNDYSGDGKDCDDGNLTDGDGCSSDCLHEGSKPNTQIAAVCGNNTIEPGETCEAILVGGQPVFPPGCDATKCLHTGTLACVQGETQKCCGNGFIDQGEDCDDGNKNRNDGCSSSCLFEGSSPYYWGLTSMSPSFCGNGILEKGEQCEIGAPSNVIAQQIGYPGINPADPPLSGQAALFPVIGKTYAAYPSKVDRSQLAFIVGLKEPDPETGRSSSTISAVLMEQTGKSTYGLQCGYTDESSCAPDGTVEMGLDRNGCCRARPYSINTFPISPPTVCRNVQISVEFKDRMDSASVVNNFKLAQEPDAADKCPAGTQELIVKNQVPGEGWWNKIKAWWQGLVAWFTGAPAYAEKWCIGGITGQLYPVGDPKAPTKFAFNLDKALPANTRFRAILKGDDDLSDNNDLNKRLGIKTATGVVHDGDLAWTFETHDRICTLNVVTINDATGLQTDPPPPEQPGQEHPYLFINRGNKPEYRQFEAVAQAIENNHAVALSSTEEYGWEWEPWTSSDIKLVNYSDKLPLPQGPTAEFRTQQEGGIQLNGTAILTAGIEVVKDTINIPSSVSSTIFGVAPVTVLACENPWPSLLTAPFRDAATVESIIQGVTTKNIYSSTLPFANFKAEGYFNFSTMYCRDAGEAHEVADDLPAMVINPVPRTKIDRDKGVLRQYLFSFGNDRSDLKQDGIGVRVMENPMHLSPEEWYAMQGFTGNAKSVTVDSYPALQDGSTIYVAAANQPKTDGPIYSNIYIISHNPNATKDTLQIYDQMVKYLAFNINILGQSNTCHEVQGTQYSSNKVYLPQVAEGQLTVPVSCSADNECVALRDGLNLFCDANKLKMARDTIRMADFQKLNRRLGQVFGLGNKYPQLTGGTFIKGMSNSLWNSWGDEFGKVLNGGAPVDPVNSFVTCGKCADGTLCMDDKTCADRKLSDTQCKGGWMDNGVWKFDSGIDPKSCWSTQKSEFLCPKYRSSNPFSVSRLYQYRSFAGGSQYELASEFEVRPMTASQLDWWSPPLPEVMHRCVTPETQGRYCTNVNGQPDDNLCRKCSNPANCKVCKLSGFDCTSDPTVCKGIDSCIDYPAVNGACQPFGGTFRYSDICTNQIYAENGICGDGVKNTAGKNCSVSLQPCTSDSDCAPGGGYCMGELCELGETRSVKCATDPTKPSILDGHRLQTCVACTKFDTDPQHPQCVPDVKCGNGRIDKRCAGTNQGCMSNADCTMGLMCINAEACDDGVLNGTYGHCAVGCGGFGGFCGNAQLDAGETCDKGVQNGTWSSQMNPATCSLDCRGVGPYCGDQTIQQPNEECDGQTETTQKAICQGTSILCETNADCPTGKTCGSPITLAVAESLLDKLGLGMFRGYLSIQAAVAAPPPPQESSSIFKSSFWKTFTSSGMTVTIPVGQVLEYVNGQGQDVKAGTYADCSQLFIEQTDGGKRPTQHVRTCNSPGAASACKWNSWSACVPIGVCGDGVKEPNEECDDGANNGDTKACTKLCKKNVCGDGKLNVGVEECDNGIQNGQPTCNADYNSSCLSCNLGCKFMASAGGYCGDGIKNGAEQCDGTDGLKDSQNKDITCKMLGYDYAENSNQFWSMAEIQAADDAWSFSTFTGAEEDSKKLVTLSSTVTYQKLFVSSSDLVKKVSLTPTKTADVNLFDFGGVGTFSVDTSAITKVASADSQYNPEAAKCMNTCSFGGCKKCSLDPGTGIIKGRVYDIVFQQVVPNARITLTYRGVKVDETYTDMNGVFQFSKLNSNKACDSYKIVIDMYEDNVCTGNSGGECYRGFTPPWTYPYDIDEGKQGGYFPFTSDIFSVTSFAASVNGKDSDNVPHIDIFPRPERGMAYAAITWKPVVGNERVWYKLHTVLPQDFAFTGPMKPESSNLVSAEWDDANAMVQKCDYGQRPAVVDYLGQDWIRMCSRDIFHYQVGKWDTAKFPYTRLICLHRTGEKTDGWINPKYNGCPIEGYKQCLINQNKGKTAAGCKTSNDPLCVACGVDAGHVENGSFTCSENPRFADCGNPMSFGPLTSLVNFAPMVAANTNQPVSFYFVAGDGGSAGLRNALHSADSKFVAYAAITRLNGSSEIKAAEKPDLTGWAWHVGDLDPKTQEIKIVNQLKGKDGAMQTVANCFGTTASYKTASACQKPIPGLAAWSYWFQASGHGSHCVRNPNTNGNDPAIESDPLKWDLMDGNAVCFRDAEVDKCIGNYQCGYWSYNAWNWVNY